MTCICSHNRYQLCKNIRVQNLLGFLHKNIVNNEMEYFTKENLIYINNIDEIEVYDELIKDLSKKYINEPNIKNIMLKYATKKYKTNLFLPSSVVSFFLTKLIGTLAPSCDFAVNLSTIYLSGS